jgi:hypothetical protein
MFSLDDLQQMLGETGAVQQISQQVGADEGQTQGLIQAALPLLMGALARNASTPEGAQSLAGALDRDHDGSILDNLGGFLGSGDTSAGSGILGHLFGGGHSAIADALGSRFGLNSGQTMQILMMLAPVVMGMLGRAKQQQGLDPGGLSDMLGQQSAQAQQASGMMGMLGQLLDRNHDGSAVDDIAGMIGGMFRR